jgi:hypothetical protein
LKKDCRITSQKGIEREGWNSKERRGVTPTISLLLTCVCPVILPTDPIARLANCSLVLINMGIIAKDISHRTDRPSLSQQQQPNQQTKERLKAKHGDQFFLSLRAGTKGKTGKKRAFALPESA